MHKMLLALGLIALSCPSLAEDQGLFYIAAGSGTGKANIAVGAGTTADVVEAGVIDLGTVGGSYAVKFKGLSLVQNAVAKDNFNLMFRVGFGKATTTFANGQSAGRTGFGNGVFFGLGAQYQAASHLAFRAEVNRITYATATDGGSHATTWPVTLSAMYIF